MSESVATRPKASRTMQRGEYERVLAYITAIVAAAHSAERARGSQRALEVLGKSIDRMATYLWDSSIVVEELDEFDRNRCLYAVALARTLLEGKFSQSLDRIQGIFEPGTVNLPARPVRAAIPPVSVIEAVAPPMPAPASPAMPIAAIVAPTAARAAPRPPGAPAREEPSPSDLLREQERLREYVNAVIVARREADGMHTARSTEVLAVSIERLARFLADNDIQGLELGPVDNDRCLRAVENSRETLGTRYKAAIDRIASAVGGAGRPAAAAGTAVAAEDAEGGDSASGPPSRADRIAQRAERRAREWAERQSRLGSAPPAMSAQGGAKANDDLMTPVPAGATAAPAAPAMATSMGEPIEVAEVKMLGPAPAAAAAVAATVEAPPAPAGQPDLRRIALIEDDPVLAKHITHQLSQFGYEVQSLPNLENAADRLGDLNPSVIVCDVMLPEGMSAGPDAIAAIRSLGIKLPPVVFLSARDDFDTRLRAVRAGAKAYVTKPFEFSELIETIDRVTAQRDSEPYRALVVDDQKDVLRFNEYHLQKAGMITRSTTDPTRVLELLFDFRPDIILTDLQMPQCSGLELAAVVRQQEAFVGIPIIFLSAVTDPSAQFAALQHGGDVFLTKPIQPEHLVAAAVSRAERARKVSALMFHDSLTGLLNHSASKEQLSRELARSMRTREPLCFALVDIDHFKKVNDNYGHPAGDRVLKAFSRMLRQRLRKTDVIGRYGGEEFAVLLPNTPIENARAVLDEIRERFSEVTHEAEGKSFSVTFSCGVAGYPPYDIVDVMTDAADKALYRAKSGGRNRVMLADLHGQD